ncbi:flagellar motor protein MotB [Anaeromyxobacter diazotrophicus]|uniref:Flagellar basal body stator protein MotB n=1 Tax=Anaeromyxobacter diazotrophicus TaxID=2590199 RepID=A0A7I9VKP4_9BACT|nr:flagellar motor protein MotB [Anaeromyxobacter diazotrophicus]GEJ56986.1 flagellar basal body stator protein MotB [Anaeromyxobacter diazotrophicus]
MAKKKHEEEHENHERWLVSYADFITLLFAFFVVMYSVSRVDNKRLSQATESIKWALHMNGTGGVGKLPLFDGPPSDGGDVVSAPAGGGGTSAAQRAAIENFRRKIENRVRPFIMQRPGPTAVTVSVEGQRVTVRLAAADFFDAGQAALRPQIMPLLDAIAEEVVPLERPLRIEGHTDDTPVAGDRFHDNWELSAARAATVASYLERAHHADPHRLSATGFASTRPIAQGDTLEARELNRRVEMVVELELKAPPRPRKDPPPLDPLPH